MIAATTSADGVVGVTHEDPSLSNKLLSTGGVGGRGVVGGGGVVSTYFAFSFRLVLEDFGGVTVGDALIFVSCGNWGIGCSDRK